MNTFDSLDMQLIQLLAVDARQSSEELSKKLGVSSATIRRRLRHLFESNTIQVVAVVNARKIGLPLAVVIALDVIPDKLEQVAHILASQLPIRWVSTTTGRFDILALARFHSSEELSEFIEKTIAEMEGIRNSEMFVCLREKRGSSPAAWAY